MILPRSFAFSHVARFWAYEVEVASVMVSIMPGMPPTLFHSVLPVKKKSLTLSRRVPCWTRARWRPSAWLPKT